MEAKGYELLSWDPSIYAVALSWQVAEVDCGAYSDAVTATLRTVIGAQRHKFQGGFCITYGGYSKTHCIVTYRRVFESGC